MLADEPSSVGRTAESPLEIGIVVEAVADCFDVTVDFETETDRHGSWG
jgi:hypothetical protein